LDLAAKKAGLQQTFKHNQNELRDKEKKIKNWLNKTNNNKTTIIIILKK